MVSIGVIIVNKMVKEGLPEELLSEQRPEYNGEASGGNSWERLFQTKETEDFLLIFWSKIKP